MSVYLWASGGYTPTAVRYLAQAVGVRFSETPSEADAFWVSIEDPLRLSVLRRARKESRGRLVVMGGFEAFFARPYLAWADAVVVGEASDFVEAWARGGPGEALSLPCVLTRDRLAAGQAAVPCSRVDYGAFPVARFPSGSGYFLAQRGCRRRCTFCATAACIPYSRMSDAEFARAVSAAQAAGLSHVTPIGTDSTWCGEMRDLRGVRIAASDVPVCAYITDSMRYQSKGVKFGVEGWTEAARRAFRKPIADKDLREVQRLTKAQGQKCDWFMLAGYPGWKFDDVARFAGDVLVPDTATWPKIVIKTTWLVPEPHTDLALEAFDPAEPFDKRRAQQELGGVSRRVVVTPPRCRARSAWRAAFRRCSPEQAILLGPEPGKMPLDDFRRDLEEKGLLSLLGAQTKSVDCGVAIPGRA